LDAAPGGMGDWLADIVTGTPVTATDDQRKQEMLFFLANALHWSEPQLTPGAGT